MGDARTPPIDFTFQVFQYGAVCVGQIKSMCCELYTWKTLVPPGSWRSEVSGHASLPSRRRLLSAHSGGGAAESSRERRHFASALKFCLLAPIQQQILLRLNFPHRCSVRVVYLCGWYLTQKTASSRHEWFGKCKAHFWSSMYISYYLQIDNAQILDSSSIPFCGVSFHLCTARCNVISNPLSLSLSSSAV